MSRAELRGGVGDMYELVYDDERVAFMQHVLSDDHQLQSAVVRVFAELHDPQVLPNLEQVAQGSAKFYSHVFPTAGKTLGLWRKVGVAQVALLPKLEWFTPPANRLRDQECDEWLIWSTVTPPEMVTSSDPRLGRAEFGMVMAPDQLLERVRTGQWSLPCPQPVGGAPWHFVKARTT